MERDRHTLSFISNTRMRGQFDIFITLVQLFLVHFALTGNTWNRKMRLLIFRIINLHYFDDAHHIEIKPGTLI